MEFIVVCLAAMSAAALTLFSGFGLGTLLMPAFALFFPIPVAVAATAVVHLANNVFKVVLVGRHAVPSVVAWFALPAAAGAMVGATVLSQVSRMSPIASYSLLGTTHEVDVVGIVVGTVIIAFALLDVLPVTRELAFDRRLMPLGGAVSGFFGGLSGNQGALRSAFLIRLGLSKEAFIGTGTVAAVVVDVTRLAVYGVAFYAASMASITGEVTGLVLAGIVAAFIGSFVGNRLVRKVTLETVQLVVAVGLVIVGAAMIAGVL